MEKHHVKNGPPHPKNGPPHKPRSDPSNDEYITVVKKVTFDSLVEFSPHELNSCHYTVLYSSTTVPGIYTVGYGALQIGRASCRERV